MFYVVSAYHLLKHEMALFRVDWLLVPFLFWVVLVRPRVIAL